MSAHAYRAYGLAITADRPLEGLGTTGPGTLGTVRIGVRDASAAAIAEGEGAPALAAGWERTWALAGGGRLTRYDAPWPGHAWTMRFAAGGARIAVERTPGLPLGDVLNLVGTIGLVTALQMRGVPALHGCAVEVGERAVVVLGASGAGKSTTAAAFVRAGHALLSDDIAVVSGATVLPGAPRLHLGPETAAALGWPGLPRLFATAAMGDKRFLALGGDAFCPEARELAAVYVLGRRRPAAAAVEPVPARAALAILGVNVFRREALGRAQHAALLPSLARLASSGVRRVAAPEGLARAGEVVEAIAADVGSLRRPAPAR